MESVPLLLGSPSWVVCSWPAWSPYGDVVRVTDQGLYTR
jgi:hypothetical protein